MSTASSNMQWMLNDFNGYKVKFNRNNPSRCLVSVTRAKQPNKVQLTFDAMVSNDIHSKVEAVKFLLGEFNNV